MTSITRMSIIPSVIVCAALAPTSRALAQEPAKEKPPVRTVMKTSGSAHGFSIVLVLGDLQGGPASDNVPPAARKALADMKDFLPYKSYRLLDTAWVLGATRVTSRLRGPEDQDYELDLAAGGPFGESKTLRVEFQLREAGSEITPAPERGAEAARMMQMMTELMARRNALDQELRSLQERSGDNAPAVAEMKSRLEGTRRQIAELENRGLLRRRNQIINTTFSMDLGETVVVGTSRLKGDKALIALLTAVPRTAK